MKRPSKGFVGIMVGLAMIFLIPAQMVNSTNDVWYWLIVLPVSGVIIEVVIRLILRRND